MQFQTRDGRFAFEFARWGDVAKDHFGLDELTIESPNFLVLRVYAQFGTGPFVTIRVLTPETLANALIDAGEMLARPRPEDDYGDDDDDIVDPDDGGKEMEIPMDRKWTPDMADKLLRIHPVPKLRTGKE